MNIGFKAATTVALASMSVAALFASGVSMADDTIPSLATGPVALSGSVPGATAPQPVRFAPAKEIVQPLSATAQSIAAPSAQAAIGVPGRDYSSLAAKVADMEIGSVLDAETRCLAAAVFYEARSESLEGQLAVARVIVNRAASARFRDSLCGVVKQPGQFSFVRGGAIPEPAYGGSSWKTAIAIARIAVTNGWESAAEGALYFHARRVAPAWARKRVAAIDNHIFYR